MIPIIHNVSVIFPPEAYHVVLDGRIIGYIEEKLVDETIESLRYLKIT